MADLHKNHPQYDVSVNQQELILRKWQKRQKTREEFQKLKYDPYFRKNNSVMFDDAIERFHAMKIHQGDHFRPNLKNKTVPLILIAACIAFAVYVDKDRKAEEHRYRTGQVAYKDRADKIIT